MGLIKDITFLGFFYIFNFIVILTILILVHQKEKNFQGNNSTMNPEYDLNLEQNIKNNYNWLKDDRLSDSVIEDYLLRYGIESSYFEFTLNKDTKSELKGNNLINFIKGERDNQYKCFLFAYDRDNFYETIVYFTLIDYFKSSDFPFGLNILAIGYSEKFKRYSLGVKEYMKLLYSENNPFPECYFITDGLSIDIKESIKNNFILLSIYGINSNGLQKNYNQILNKNAKRMRETKVYLVDPNQKYESKITYYLNYFIMNPFGFNADYSLVFTSIKRYLFNNPNENHNLFLNLGINSFTNKLFINPQGKVITTLQNFIKLSIDQYNIANSNDYTSLDTNYIYLVYNFENTVFKDKIIISSIISFVIYLFFNFIYILKIKKEINFIENIFFMTLNSAKIFLLIIFINYSNKIYNKYSKYLFNYNKNFNSSLCVLDEINYEINVINYLKFVFIFIIIYEIIYLIFVYLFIKLKNIKYNLGYITISSKLVMDSIMFMISINNIGYNVFTIIINFFLAPFIFLRSKFLKFLYLSFIIYILINKNYINNYYYYLNKLPRIKDCNEDNKMVDFNYYNLISSIFIIWNSFIFN